MMNIYNEPIFSINFKITVSFVGDWVAKGHQMFSLNFHSRSLRIAVWLRWIVRLRLQSPMCPSHPDIVDSVHSWPNGVRRRRWCYDNIEPLFVPVVYQPVAFRRESKQFPLERYCADYQNCRGHDPISTEDESVVTCIPIVADWIDASMTMNLIADWFPTKCAWK